MDKTNAINAYLQAVDVEYSYRLAKKMETYKTNPVLGFRTAGSPAEIETCRMLAREMEAAGLKDIHMDELTLDSWEFKRAVMRFADLDGQMREIQLWAYQTNFVTEGFQEFEVVDLGRGTAEDYEGRDVRGKLVLVHINQRNDWWINYPAYQAHLRGAAAILAVQAGGYGEVDEQALNAQNICGPREAPAFSMSRKDAAGLARAAPREECAPRRQRGAGRGRTCSAITGARRGSSRCGGARRDAGGGGGGAAGQVGQRRSRVGREPDFAARRSEQGAGR